METQEHRFQTYITIGNFTRRYYGCHEKNAAGVEAAAIFYSLKHVTNVLGYRIIDLNYPTLATMVADLNRWNAEINMLQLLAMFMMNQTNQMYDDITTAYEPLHMLDFYSPTWEHIVRSTSEALDMVNNYWSDIDYLYHKCDEHKVIHTASNPIPTKKKRLHLVQICAGTVYLYQSQHILAFQVLLSLGPSKQASTHINLCLPMTRYIDYT